MVKGKGKLKGDRFIFAEERIAEKVKKEGIITVLREKINLSPFLGGAKP